MIGRGAGKSQERGMQMRPIEIGLVDTTGTVGPHTMADVVAALNVQVTQHLPRYWSTAPDAIVRMVTEPQRIPRGVWPVMLVDHLKYDEGGFHYLSHNQPAAKVLLTQSSNDWSISASHEVLEMLVDPSGNRLQLAPGIKLNGGAIEEDGADCQYLLEICDPCEAVHYMVGEVKVADFATPDFYEPLQGGPYSFTGSIKVPRRILPGGYITWISPTNSEIWQMIWLDRKGDPKIRCVGKPAHEGKDEVANLRGFVDGRTHHLLRAAPGFPFRFKIDPGTETPEIQYAHEHWVTFQNDGSIETTHLPAGTTASHHVRQRDKPSHRPAGTHHKVKNVGPSLLLGGKDLINPATLRP